MDGIEQKSSRNYKQWFLITLVVGAGLMVISGGIWVYQKTISDRKSKEALVTPTPAEEEIVASPTPEVTTAPAQKAELKIQILNGGGIKGEAARAAALLEKVDFTDIKTGNADKFDYEETEIQIEEDKKEFAPEIIEALSAKYTVSPDLKTLDAKSTFDVIITLGKNK